jgi:hypothetical protein
MAGVVEKLSLERFERLYHACKPYYEGWFGEPADWGIRHIFIFDPDYKEAWRWNKQAGRFNRIESLVLDNVAIPVSAIFEELDAGLSEE